MSVYIVKDGRIISRTKDLRKLIWYAGKFRVKEVTVTKLFPQQYATARLQIEFANGAFCGTDFASFQICVDFVKARIKNWQDYGYGRKPVFRLKKSASGGLGKKRIEFPDHTFIVEG